MKLTDIFIRRPVLAICINLLVLVAGLKSIDSLATRQYPKSDLAVVNVTTTYVGANSDLIRGYITTPLERAIASADGIDYIDSTSEQNQSKIRAHLVLNYDVGEALTQIQAKVAQVRNDLPPSAEIPVIEVESSDNRFASMYLSFYSDVLETNQITDYLIRVVQPKLSSVLGVQKADVLGSNNYAMRIWLNSAKLSALNISATEIQESLQKNNFLSAIGTLKGQYVITPLVANTDLNSVQDFKRLVIKSSGNTLIRLQDVAEVELGAENYDSEVRFDGKKASFMGIWALPNANSLEVIKAVRKILPQIEHNLPEGLKLSIPYDGTEYIGDALREVGSTLLETIAIVIVVIFLFMGSFRSVLVPVVAIPISLIGAVGLMALFGFTINLLTLLAIVLAVGLVVDDAIVMLENIERNLSEGMAPYDAAIKGARELATPVIAMTITLAAVYAPIGIQGGLTGTLFKEFAFTLSGAVLVSGFVALTLSPMMTSKLLANHSKTRTPFQTKIDIVFNKVKNNYHKLLLKSLRKN
jgi:multidrug efflux pump